MKKDPSGFSTSLKVKKDQDEFFFHKLNAGDKIILNVHINSIIDSTYSVERSARSTVDAARYTEWDEEVPDALIEPKLIIGNHANMKVSIVAAEIGKLVTLITQQDLILSIGSRWFGKPDEVLEDDFEKLMFILENVKKVL